MTYVLHRTLHGKLPTITGGEGNYLIDANGQKYLDACGGAAVSCLGHNNRVVRDAVKKQIEKIAFAHTGFFTNEPAEELAELLVTSAPKGTGKGRIMYLGSGSEAMEAALKLARQYHVERGEVSRTRIIARKPSYHGNTLGALATGGHTGRRAPFQPMLMEVDHIEATYEYRLRKNDESEQDFALRMANQLEETIERLGALNVMAFVAEPVVGASLGTQTAPAGYFRRIREICDKYGVVYIADEVMCGMGRTGSLFALEQEAIHADITTMAKGLGAGYQPIAAVMACEKIITTIEEGSALLWNGHTYMSHAVASAAALAVQKEISEKNLLTNVRERGRQLKTALDAEFGQNTYIGDIRGRGLFQTIEIVADKTTKSPFCPEKKIAANIQKTALELGLMCYPAQGCVDGTNGDHILLAPSYISTDNEIDRIVTILGSAVSLVLDRVA